MDQGQRLRAGNTVRKTRGRAFLVLARKAGVLRWPDSVGGWLHDVAHRIVLKARAQAVRRGEQERPAGSDLIDGKRDGWRT